MGRKAKFIGELPDGYEYKFVKNGDQINIIGIALDKKPIAFTLKEDKIVPIELDI